MCLQAGVLKTRFSSICVGVNVAEIVAKLFFAVEVTKEMFFKSCVESNLPL